MPLYSFACDACGETYDAVAAVGASAPCPNCQSAEVRRVYTAPGVSASPAPKGVAARRSNAVRAAREEQRRERREARRNADRSKS
ncbi:MAG TPA: zinc ribbon domain-containing protein [Solirubrobacteraceae bacterium]